MKAIKVSREVFLKNLEICLTVQKRIASNLFECEYVTPALEKRIVIITTL